MTLNDTSVSTWPSLTSKAKIINHNLSKSHCLDHMNQHSDDLNMKEQSSNIDTVTPMRRHVINFTESVLVKWDFPSHFQ